MGTRKPDSNLAAFYYGDLLTTRYVSPRGNVYPGHYYERNGNKIDRLVVHHFANGSVNVTRQGLLATFKRRNGSVTYAVFSDGQIVQFLPESVAPWTTSSYDIDVRAITIEVENNSDTYSISSVAYRSLVNLLADICDRNHDLSCGLKYDGTKAGSNIHMHKWYAATSCPGPYIENLIVSGKLAEDVNKALEGLRLNGVKEVISVDVKTPVYMEGHGEHDKDGDLYFIESDGSLAVSKFAYVRDQKAWKYYGNDGKAKKGWWILKDGKGTPRLYYFDLVTGAMLKGMHDMVMTCDFDLVQGFANNINTEV